MANARIVNASTVFDDTEVVNDPDAPAPLRRSLAPTRPPVDRLPPIAIPRTTTDELLAMHVYLDGCYHRRIPSLSHTACRRPLHSELAATRPGPRQNELRNPLCRAGCFSAFELELADELDAKEAEEALTAQSLKERTKGNAP